MKFIGKLKNPFALVAQGFVLGGLVFFATHSETFAASAAPTDAPPSIETAR